MIEVDRVTCAFGARRVLEDFSFSLEAGAQALLLGPSGSGKTTLIYLLCGLISPDSGSVRIAGEVISALPQSKRDALRRAHVGVVFQTLRLVSALSVRANLALAQKLSGKAQDSGAVEVLLDRLGIAHRGHAKTSELSQGEAQRAAIARALITRPSLLIADEPTSALDDDNAAVVADLLIETAKAEGAALLIATHDSRLRGRIERTVELCTKAA
jgi:putative ABC transport system ATP-binding protein